MWVGTATAAQVTVAIGTSVIHSSFDPAALSMLAPTLVRVRGNVTVFPSAFSTDSIWEGAYGLGIVSDEAFTAGAASLPRPHDDDDWPGWVVHGYFQGKFETQSAVGQWVLPINYTIDSKAMRKIGPGETVVWVVESNLGPALEFVLSARVLMMLS